VIIILKNKNIYVFHIHLFYIEMPVVRGCLYCGKYFVTSSYGLIFHTEKCAKIKKQNHIKILQKKTTIKESKQKYAHDNDKK